MELPNVKEINSQTKKSDLTQAKTKQELYDALIAKIEDMYFFEELSFEDMSEERKDMCFRCARYIIDQDPFDYWIGITSRGIEKSGAMGVKKTEKEYRTDIKQRLIEKYGDCKRKSSKW